MVTAAVGPGRRRGRVRQPSRCGRRTAPRVAAGCSSALLVLSRRLGAVRLYAATTRNKRHWVAMMAEERNLPPQVLETDAALMVRTQSERCVSVARLARAMRPAHVRPLRPGAQAVPVPDAYRKLDDCRTLVEPAPGNRRRSPRRERQRRRQSSPACRCRSKSRTSSGREPGV